MLFIIPHEIKAERLRAVETLWSGETGLKLDYVSGRVVGHARLTSGVWCFILLSFQKLGFGATFCKSRERRRKGWGRKNDMKFGVSVKMKNNIIKFRNISFSYVRASVFLQYSIIVLGRHIFWIWCSYLTCWLVYLIVFLNNYTYLWQLDRTFQKWITFAIEKAWQATKCMYEYIFKPNITIIKFNDIYDIVRKIIDNDASIGFSS